MGMNINPTSVKSQAREKREARLGQMPRRTSGCFAGGSCCQETVYFLKKRLKRPWKPAP